MNLKTIQHHRYEKGLPQEGNFILGQKRGANIFVYQAFNDKIADYAIKNQKFGGQDYSFDRMTWIKPNFLWMMYRSDWSNKDSNQSRILAIEMTYEGFEELLTEGVLTSYDKLYGDEFTWKENLDNSNVRIQWDPDHDIKGDKLKRRAVQIGIKNEALEKFNNELIKSIQDITDFVKEQKAKIDSGNEWFYVMNESIIEVNNALKKKFSIPDVFRTPFVEEIISEYDQTKSVSQPNFEKLLIENDQPERDEFVGYVKNYKNIELSRYLLKTAIVYRRDDEMSEFYCMCEDLLMFSYFASKNKHVIDLHLVLEAKLVDFDTWCGFDGEMIFYPLGYQQTKDYIANNKEFLVENVEGFAPQTADYFIESFDEEYLYKQIHSRAFWYF
ncbi:DUF4291 domain-containing protein [Flavobacterium sp. 17A]|uniref:DUF4291 domain-containing protein n=1 Tax=Flavobacterium potami TaxID=2872310 RepID=A0A9X1HEE2_9FLAO|nr:DUF4291 domain-containing protein [Flavobacterium potami]MBZ4037655.1 DUF4291 domain-containing protein [Flavobacterium potami]